jgi:excisionase family DNA binding protein
LKAKGTSDPVTPITLPSRRRNNVGGKASTPTSRGPWLSAEQVAIYLALPSHGSVRELERRGVLPAHRLGKSLRFSRAELDAMLCATRQNTVEEYLDGESVAVRVTNEPLGPLMTPEEAAEYLGLPSASALDHRVRRGQVPSYRVGRAFRFRAAELDAVVARGTRPSSIVSILPSEPLTPDDGATTSEDRRPLDERKGGQ